MPTNVHSQFVAWFRSAAPYFNAFRGKTFVIAFGGEVVADGKFDVLTQDINLLRSTGIRLVLVHGSRPQIEAQLRQRGARSRYHAGVRVTDAVALACAKEAAGLLRVELDALLSQGLPNTPMAGAAINTVSGNFITAQPMGVLDGVDLQYTGTVRKVNTAAIESCLAAEDLVIISSVGYSPTGEVFNLSMEDVAVAIAKALQAAKLVFLSDTPVEDARGRPMPELSAQEAELLLAQGKNLSEDTRLYLSHAVEAVRAGVARAHLVSHKVDGALLLELFTHGGSGSMITADGLERLRPASIDDIGGILQLIEPLESEGTLVYRGRELLEREVHSFFVIEHDGIIVGCAALYPLAGKAVELAALAVRPEYQGRGYGEKLLEHGQVEARQLGYQKLFVLTTRSAQWFVERGYTEVAVKALPEPKKSLYNLQRRSKILRKKL
ncbi:MAG: amino-acid N-acetyltransferase [Burkholderiales bacterium]|nr:amino-acid N-acetyltransferase [Burkholderiales bacterium]